MKKPLTILFVLLLAISTAFSSNSRIEAMGKTDDFFVDDMSIFMNPANMVLYRTYVIGELGHINFAGADTQDYAADPGSLGSDRNNRYFGGHDPFDPWFGGVYSYTLLVGGGVGELDEKQIKRNTFGLSIGMAVNRTDPMEVTLQGLVSNLNELYSDTTRNGSATFAIQDTALATGDTVRQPVNEFDFLLGFKTKGQLGVGLGFYRAGYKVESTVLAGAAAVNLYKSGILGVKLGVNKLLKSGSFLDLALNIGMLDYTVQQDAAKINVSLSKNLYVDSRFRYLIHIREAINIIPIVKISMLDIEATGTNGNVGHIKDIYRLNGQGVGAGVGVNYVDDETEFNAGLVGHYDITKLSYNHNSAPGTNVDQMTANDQAYVVINFGIERQIKWEWLYLRAGGRKVIGVLDKSKLTVNGQDVSEDSESFTNAEADGTLSDLIGIGLGINVMKRLKFDMTVSEDIPYRVGHFLSGLKGNIISRASISYQF